MRIKPLPRSDVLLLFLPFLLQLFSFLFSLYFTSDPSIYIYLSVNPSPHNKHAHLFLLSCPFSLFSYLSSFSPPFSQPLPLPCQSLVCFLSLVELYVLQGHIKKTRFKEMSEIVLARKPLGSWHTSAWRYHLMDALGLGLIEKQPSSVDSRNNTFYRIVAAPATATASLM